MTCCCGADSASSILAFRFMEQSLHTVVTTMRPAASLPRLPRMRPGPVRLVVVAVHHAIIITSTVVFRQSVLIGETTLTAEEVQSLVQTLGQTYKGNRYHLLQRNCNHFASDLSYQLCGQHAPGWVNRLANIAVMLHCLLPAAWVPPLTPPTAVPAAFDENYSETDRLLGQPRALPQAVHA